MTNRKWGVGIIGCGGISRSHADSYAMFSEDCVLKAVADISIDNSRKLAAAVGGDVDAYGDYRELLSRPDIDIVSICTPPFTHKEIVIQVLLAGKHVLCEKPLAPSLQDCDEMIETARRNRRKLAVAFQYRYRKDMNQMKRIVDSGILDRIVFARMNGLYWRGAPYYNVPWRGKFETECGGVTMNLAIHPLDVFLWIMGDVASVSAEIDTLVHQIEVEDTATANIQFKNGAVAQISCSVNAVQQDVSMTIAGKYRSVSLTDALSEQSLRYHAVRDNGSGFSLQDEQGIEQMKRIAAEIDTGTGDHFGLIGDLLAAIREDREPLVNGYEGRRSIEAITAIYKSATTGMKVSLPLASDDPWYTTDGILQNVKRHDAAGMISKVMGHKV